MFVSLHGLGTAEALRRIAAMVDEAQEDYLVSYELDLLDAGLDVATVARKLACYRDDLEVLRDQAVARAAALLERYGVAS